MPLFRLLQYSLVIAAVAATLAAQSSPANTPSAKASPGSEHPETLSNRLTVQSDPPSNPDSFPQLKGYGESAGSRNCLKMRMYKVRRDGPQSDSTHFVGYTTCLPAERIRTYTAGEQLQLRMP